MAWFILNGLTAVRIPKPEFKVFFFQYGLTAVISLLNGLTAVWATREGLTAFPDTEARTERAVTRSLYLIGKALRPFLKLGLEPSWRNSMTEFRPEFAHGHTGYKGRIKEGYFTLL